MAVQRGIPAVQRPVDPLGVGGADQAVPVGVQRLQGGLVGAGNAGVVVQQQQGLGAVFRALAEPEIQPAQGAFAHQAVCDAARHALHQGQQVFVLGISGAGQIQNAQDVACGRKNRRGIAAEDAVAGQKVLGPMDAHGPAVVQGGADGIGAAQGLGPADTGLQRDAAGFVLETVAAALVQDQAAGIGQQHHAM